MIILGLNNYYDAAGDDLKSTLVSHSNDFMSELAKLKQTPPSQFNTEGIPLAENESPEDLHKYKDGYLDTISKFQEIASSFTFPEGIKEVTKWQSEYEKQKPTTRAEFWYIEGCRLSCFDLLDGTKL